jgi:uncharacterized membrane protein
MGKIHEIFLANHGNLWHTGSTETELKEVYHVMDHVIKTILPPIIGVLELMGIFVVAWSGLRGFWDYLQNTFRHKNYPVQYNLASGMSTALAFKMAAEILKTVLVHDLSELLILGAIVLLRGAMSLLLHFELKHSKQDRAAAQEMETGSTEDIGSSALPT